MTPNPFPSPRDHRDACRPGGETSRPDRWQTLLAIDHDRWAAETYRANFPGVHVVTGAVADRLDNMPAADVVLGGPPCQPHSLAGKRKASADERDGGADFVAAVAKVRPRQFLMENVPGLLTSEGGTYAYKLLAALEPAGRGYVVQIKTMDAVNYGVPQFRARCWWWGIRSDVYAAGVRHGWPVPTHAWPPPLPSMFGGDLLPGVTVGESLGLDGWYDGQNEKAHDADEPCGTIQGVAQGRGGRAGHYALRRDRGVGFIERGGERRDTPATEPAPTIGSGSKGSGPRLSLVMDRGSGLIERSGAVEQSVDVPSYTIRGAAMSGLLLQSHADPARPVTAPSPTLRSGGAGHEGCRLQLQPRVFGGGRNHPADADGNYRRDKRDITDEPSTTVVDFNGATTPTIRSPHRFGQERWKRKGDLWIRRLNPLECARLQSVPDVFAWPDDITKTAAYRVIGNGWACGMAAHMSRALAVADPDSRTVVDLFCGGGLGAVGWHGRYWSLPAELEVAPC